MLINRFKNVLFLLSIAMIISYFNVSMASKSHPLVLQTDFSLKDGAVSAIKGVIYSVNESLLVSDLTHEIPPYNVWEASYRLYQTAPYWPKGTVFVSVVDPGVGTARRSVVAESNNGYYFVTPDNGTLTLIADQFGLKEVREIDETKHRLKGSTASYTFHGRDVYGYTAAKLASGKIRFKEVGPIITSTIRKLKYTKAFINHHKLHGTLVILDPEYGNAWTNIDARLINAYHIQKGKLYKVKIYHGEEKKYEGVMAFQNTFGDVKKGENLIYINSLMNLAVGIDEGNFAKKYQIKSGPNWRVIIENTL